MAEVIRSLASYHLLGRSGLRVSPLCLGTMTFGTEWGWGADEDTSREILNRYLEAGGNFLDTADLYTNGRSEEMLGGFLKSSGRRDSVVLATKFTFNSRPGDPNAGGNGRKHIMESCENSLRRLQTDYIDLYWLHAWDTMTPEEEVMSALDSLVRSGKIRYIGLSDTPAWYIASCQRLAEWRGWERVCALQLEYSLIERNIEREHVPAALRFGAGICPWSPLAGGMLTGKYARDRKEEGRLATTASTGNPVFSKFTERNFAIVDVLLEVSRELGRTPAQVALNWATRRPGISSSIIGATKLSQLEDNLRALEFTIPPELVARLEEASRPPSIFPYTFFEEFLQDRIRGGMPIRPEPTWWRG